jgi:hypothetical protein
MGQELKVMAKCIEFRVLHSPVPAQQGTSHAVVKAAAVP